ncbi:hypothetical protein QFC22_005641 [Naganishia vaughanmartiniae]|uniref:Uncharacterized protein n=1 Tax=Naganishia vaughanmartiniae TaxID=1424756 RepID=A0ACC2WUC4_9TREE|nr:hypothetical protein QFC22_005641 [Naganishia vaughanmartiniae]
MVVRIQGKHFVDPDGRVVHLRGVNVSGCSKVPSSDPSVDVDHPAKVSYINRPFPLDEAPTHWARLKRWGLTYLRITVTWEAIEHTAPGVYDEEYLEYLRLLMESMTEAGLSGYICMHQDVWSRHTGGSGAPAWTLHAAGLSSSPSILKDTGAAYLDGVNHRGADSKDETERGLWSTGYSKLGCATMNTLFWGGETFAPSLMVNTRTGLPSHLSSLSLDDKEQNIQTFLQDRYLRMFERLMDSVRGIDGVLGFEMTNEPHAGYIGMPTLHAFDYYTEAHLGPAPSPVQGFALGAGHPVDIPVYTRSWPFPSRWTRSVVLNSAKESVWLPATDGTSAPGECVWAREDVWAWDEDRQRPTVLKEGYFSRFPTRPKGWQEGIGASEKSLEEVGRKVEFYRDFYWPFVGRWQELVNRTAGKGKMVHVETVPNQVRPKRTLQQIIRIHEFERTGSGKVYFGDAQTKDNYTLQIGNIVRAAHERLGEVPVVIGETGFPMDMNLWTYNPENCDEVGDDWNFENFSWFSQRQLDPRLCTGAQGAELDQGCRLNRQVVRPYALRTAGIPLKLEYQYRTGAFMYQFTNPLRLESSTIMKTSEKSSIPSSQTHSQTPSRITEIFLPPWLAEASSKGKLAISCSDGTVRVDETQMRVFWTHEVNEEGFVHQISIRYRRKTGSEGIRPFWWMVLLLILGILLA